MGFYTLENIYFDIKIIKIRQLEVILQVFDDRKT